VATSFTTTFFTADLANTSMPIVDLSEEDIRDDSALEMLHKRNTVQVIANEMSMYVTLYEPQDHEWPRKG
jgi:hypothetical protein